MTMKEYSTLPRSPFNQSAEGVEYTNCTSVEEEDSSNEWPACDTKQSVGEVSVMLEIWKMQSTLSLPSFQDPLWPGVVAPDRVLSMDQT